MSSFNMIADAEMNGFSSWRLIFNDLASLNDEFWVRGYQDTFDYLN